MPGPFDINTARAEWAAASEFAEWWGPAARVRAAYAARGLVEAVGFTLPTVAGEKEGDAKALDVLTTAAVEVAAALDGGFSLEGARLLVVVVDDSSDDGDDEVPDTFEAVLLRGGDPVQDYNIYAADTGGVRLRPRHMGPPPEMLDLYPIGGGPRGWRPLTS